MKTVLITGGNRNTGYGIAKLFAERGWAVIVTSRNQQSVDQAVEQLKKETNGVIFGFAHDVRQTNKVDELLQKVMQTGYIPDSIILNGAMLGIGVDPLTVPIEEWEEVLHCNVVGNFAVARTFAKVMVEKGIQGTLVFLGSVNYQDCNEGRSSYNTSKGAILSLTKSLAVDLGKFGIRTNCLMPGPIRTDRYDKLTPQEREYRDSSLPIGRVSTIEEVAKGVYFLASEESGNMTGSGVILDGGMDCLNSGRY